jgi:hypothetical protein
VKKLKIKILLTIPLIILLIPAVAMFLSNEVNWSAFDFIIAAILLYVTSLFIYIGSTLKKNG